MALAGCATQNPITFADVATKKRTVPYSQVVVEDFTQPKKTSVTDVVWVNGYVPLHPILMAEPTPEKSSSKALYRYLKTGFVASGSNGQVRLSLIDAGYYVKKDPADDVVFLQLAAAQRPRDWRCSASLNIGADTKSERKEFEVVEQMPLDLMNDQIQAFIDRCREKLVDDIAAYLQAF